MGAVVVAGLALLSSVSVAVGVKLLLLSRRTHAFPELALGTFFLLGAGFGYPLSGASRLAGSWEPVLATVSSLFTGVATAMLYAFTARVFHAGRRSGRIGMALGIALCVLYAVGYGVAQMSAAGEDERLRATMLWGGVSLVMSGGAYLWTGVVSLRQYALLRRRLALGLADPVVANRMLLWGLMMSTTVVVVAIDACLLYSGSEFARLMLIPLVTCTGGLLFAGFLMLTFFPPRRYLEAIRRGAAASA